MRGRTQADARTAPGLRQLAFVRRRWQGGGIFLRTPPGCGVFLRGPDGAGAAGKSESPGSPWAQGVQHMNRNDIHTGVE